MTTMVEAPPPARRPVRRPPPQIRPRMVLLGGLVVCALVVGIVALARHSDPPKAGHPFADAGLAGNVIPVPVGRTFLAGYPAHLPAVTVLTAEPVVARGSAPAAVSVVVCEPVPRSDVIGALTAEVTDFCTRTLSLDHLDLSDVSSNAYLVTVVVPLGNGSIRVDGVRLTFRRHGVRGQQVVRGPVTLYAGRCPPSGFDPLVDSVVVGSSCDDTKPSDS
jgi:hypothetical protein